ncbi:MAG TPA: aminotransferase class III-fold pyridoxal phosphate-dependent enzyme [Candidatus Woesebacteria bacterium]|nr:aminotransferase class III-fold pyridoxal phosphate-dependent enzyme [Candidatus Woesebacteria bacterium]
MIAYSIAKLLKNRYSPNNVDLSFHRAKATYLSESIIPSEIFAYSGQGATLQTTKGELIDLSSMTVNCILGQNDPWVNANIVAYLLSGRPSFLTTRLGSEFYYKVARRILDVIKMKKSVINHRQCNGTDVTELAVLAAYQHKNESQKILVSFNNSYHGQGLTAYHISGLQKKHRFLIHTSPTIFLNQPTNTNNIDVIEELSKNDEEILQKLEQIGRSVFAVIIEPIQVNNAVNTPTKAFMHNLKEICKRNKIALIFDEIQTGFGWLGKMTAAERYEVAPNLLALSKALTSGNGPFAALISDKMYQDIPDGTGAKTNGADIRSLVASNVVIDRLVGIPIDKIPQGIDDTLSEELQKGLLSDFLPKQKMLQQYLLELYDSSKGMVNALKGYGLIRGIEIVDAQGNYDETITKKIHYDLLDSGVLIRYSHHTLIFKPPIVISESEMEKGFEIVKKVIKKYN